MSVIDNRVTADNTIVFIEGLMCFTPFTECEQPLQVTRGTSLILICDF
jgi:hypothetical protein